MCQSRKNSKTQTCSMTLTRKRCPGLEHFETCLLVRREALHLRTLKWETHLSNTARTLWQERAEGWIDEVKENAKQHESLCSVFRFGLWKWPTMRLHSKILSQKKKTKASPTSWSQCQQLQESSQCGNSELDPGKAEHPPLVKKLYPVSYRPWLKC